MPDLLGEPGPSKTPKASLGQNGTLLCDSDATMAARVPAGGNAGANLSENLQDNSDRHTRIWTPTWIDYPEAIRGLARLEALYEHPRTDRPPSMLIVGQSNMGKTSLVRQFQKSKTPPPAPSDEHIHVPVLYVQSPPTADGAALYSSILRSINAPFAPSWSIARKQDQVLRLLETIGTKVLIVDELHSMLEGKSDQRGIYMNVLKHLSNELRISIVGVGTKQVLRVIQTDQQMGSRFSPFILKKWAYDRSYAVFVVQIAKRAGIQDVDILQREVFLKKLLQKSEGLTGETWTLMCLMIEHAFAENNGKLDVDILDSVDWVAPSDRRKQPVA